jgi:hypothetical protein
MKEDLNKYQNQLKELPSLNEFSFENVFKMYKDDGFYAYNILRTVKIPEKLDEGTFDNIRLAGELPWTIISQKLYGTIKLWWLLCLTNKILNPVTIPAEGTIIKVIKPNFVRVVIEEIKSQTKSN